MKRCTWVHPEKELYCKYHDEEWGVPVHNDRKLFEMLILEGAQAGLSWETILKRRGTYRAAFDNFDPRIVANYDSSKQIELRENPGIIRNRLKISAAVQNARAFLNIQQEWGSFDNYIWHFVGGKAIQNSHTKMEHIPVKTDISDSISKDLKKRGMSFVGSVIMYAFMQAVGLVNDHEVSCFRYKQCLNHRDTGQENG